MKITITIDDNDASEIMQNVALARGWTELSDDQIRLKVGGEFADSISSLAIAGAGIRKRQEEQAATKSAAAKISVS